MFPTIPDQLPWEWAAAIIIVGLVVYALNLRSKALDNRTTTTANAAASITDTVIEDLLKPLRQELADVRAELVEVKAQKATLDVEIALLRAEITKLTSDSDDRCAGLRKENQKLSSEVGRLRKRVKELEEHVATLEGRGNPPRRPSDWE